MFNRYTGSNNNNTAVLFRHNNHQQLPTNDNITPIPSTTSTPIKEKKHTTSSSKTSITVKTTSRNNHSKWYWNSKSSYTTSSLNQPKQKQQQSNYISNNNNNNSHNHHHHHHHHPQQQQSNSRKLTSYHSLILLLLLLLLLIFCCITSLLVYTVTTTTTNANHLFDTQMTLYRYPYHFITNIYTSTSSNSSSSNSPYDNHDHDELLMTSSSSLSKLQLLSLFQQNHHHYPNDDPSSSLLLQFSSSSSSSSTHSLPQQRHLTTQNQNNHNNNDNKNNIKKRNHGSITGNTNRNNMNRNQNNNNNNNNMIRLTKKKRDIDNNKNMMKLRFNTNTNNNYTQKKRGRNSNIRNAKPTTATTTTTRTCTSPETNVPWIFGNTCTIHDVQKYYNNQHNHNNHNNDNQQQHIATNHSSIVVQSRTSHHICGYCNNPNNNENQNNSNDSTETTKFANYLHQLSEQIRILKQDECYQLIVYGVAFGEQYVQWLLQEPVQDEEENDDDISRNTIKQNQEHVQQLIQTHGRCFITFVLAENLNLTKTTTTNTNNNNNHNHIPTTKYFYSMDGLQLLIPIYTSDLPYKNMRRNTKIFKTMGPSYIFHWSLRIIWQDAKLIGMDMNTNINTIQQSKKTKQQKKYSKNKKQYIQQVPKKYILPNNYYHYYFQVIELSSIPHQNHVCASFMGLPFHKNTMGSVHINKINTVQFAPHCDAIYEASKRRPTISDNLHTVQDQCTYYQNSIHSLSSSSIQQQEQQQYNNIIDQEQQDHQLSLDDAMIDSAFIVWDLRTQRCKEFVATISCTWMDEIHCYSDRDQISFPYVFIQMGLQQVHNHNNDNDDSTTSTTVTKEQQQRQVEQVGTSNIITPETHHRLFAYSSTPNQPIVHITKSSCHWYFNNLNACDFTRDDIPKYDVITKSITNNNHIVSTSSFITATNRIHATLKHIFKLPKFLRNIFQSNNNNVVSKPVLPKKFKLAIVITGSFHRFIFQSSISKFIQPLTKQGHYVDYYISLSMNKAPGYRADQSYMNYIVHDPIFNKYIYENVNGTKTLLKNETIIKARVKKVIEQYIQAAGAHLRYITFQDDNDMMNDVNLHPNVIKRRMTAKQLHPIEDPDLRFPILDIRDNTTKIRTANANRNMLHLFYNVQLLYQKVIENEKNTLYIPYDYVLFLRDDTMWLQNFDFLSLIESSNSIGYDNKTQSDTNNNDPRSIDTISTESNKSRVELFVPSCDARVPSMHPAEINDHIAIVARNKADVFGNYFDHLFETNIDACSERLDHTIRYGNHKKQPIEPERGCNSEMILKYILKQNNVTIQYVGQGSVPFQRMALVNKNSNMNSTTTATTTYNENNEIQACFHKFCQSHIDPIMIHPGLQKCKDLIL